MRIAIASVQVPFISGGAELMTSGLCGALIEAGHAVEVVTLPFRFGPAAAVKASMAAWSLENFERFDCGPIDEVIALKFPAFYLQHPSKRVWLMHQHRSLYELFDTPYGDHSSNAEAVALREAVVRCDTEALSGATKVFTISQTVSDRLRRFNQIESQPVLQPPAQAELYFSADQLPYIYAPSRLESLKRQELLIRSMPLVAEPVFAVIAGEGGLRARLEALTEELGLQHRVRFLGRVDAPTMRAHYANALGVFFGPLLEDYGYITLEAMLSSRPVITCTDSGGPTHFVRDGETGFVTDPSPESIATAINTLWANKAAAQAMGDNGRKLYADLGISWARVVSELLAD